MKVVINGCFGGFGLSPAATLKLYERGVEGIATHVDKYYPPERRRVERSSDILGFEANLTKWREYLAGTHEGSLLFLTVFSPDEQYVLNADRMDRNHPELVRIVEEMGAAVNGRCADLEIVEVPDDADWYIDECYGNEHVAEKHRTWR